MTIYAMMADGCEEVEALAVVDLLRRAKLNTELVSIHDREMTEGAHGIGIRNDRKLSEIFVDQEDVIFLPGGVPGTPNMKASEAVCSLLKSHAAKNGRIAAICAAPTVLGMLGILEGRRATCYGGLEEQLTGAQVCGDAVVTDGNITTSRGMATAILLGLELIRILVDEETSAKLGASIMMP